MRSKHEENSENKSIVFFTHAPQGTLGDPSAASKLIKNLKERYKDKINITIVLIVNDKKHHQTVQNIFKGLDINVILTKQFDLNQKVTTRIEETQSIDQILKKSNGIIFFPTFHHFTDSQIRIIESYSRIWCMGKIN